MGISMLTSRARRYKATTSKRAKTKMAVSNLALVLEAAVTARMTRRRRKTRTRREPASILTLVEALTWTRRTEIPNMTTTKSIRVEMVASTLDSDSEATKTSISPTRTKKTTSLVSKWVATSMLTSRARK